MNLFLRYTLAAMLMGFSGLANAQSALSIINHSPVTSSISDPGSFSAQFSPDRIWTRATASTTSQQTTGVEPNVLAINGRDSVVDLDRLRNILSQAPRHQSGGSARRQPTSTFIYLPSPDGGFAQFSIRRSQVLSPQMEVRFPEITTYRGEAVNDASTTVVLDLTPAGFHAQVLQYGSRWFVDPKFKGNDELYVSYFKASKGEARQCLLDSTSPGILPHSSGVQSRSGDVLRSYALAIATTGEYTQFFGSSAAATSAVVTTINRVTGIYEKELGITFTIPFISAYPDPATDPFNGNNNAFLLIGESQVVLDNDSASNGLSYDIGHTFSTGAGGLASLGVVCNPSFKARGVTGLPSPTGNVFDVDFVAHEIGHQFSGNHTFNGANGNCSGANRNGSTAYEPGSGSTIQAYAGICGADNLQSNSDAQMHAISHVEMLNHVTVGSGANCGVVTSTGNSIPTPNPEGGYTIPHSTPFVMIGSGTDADNDPLTYSWEQIDLGPQAALNASDDGAIPLFRVLPPTPDAFRFFPEFASVDANTSSLSEKLPTHGRNMDFAFTARDGLGGVETAFQAITLDGVAGPFAVTSPNGGESLSGNTTVTWNVAGTDASPVSAATVNIYLSTTGSGLSYSELLLADTPNDGSEVVDLSAYDTDNAKIMISHTDMTTHTFYDISDSTFEIEPSLTLTCNGLTVTVDLNLGQSPTSGSDVILGTSADDTINGLGGNDTICGGDGFDIIFGGSGSDTIFGGDGFGVDSSANDIFGGSGNDFLYGSQHDDHLYGQAGVDYLESNNQTSLQDKIFGGSGSDEIYSYSQGGSFIRGQGNNDEIWGSDFGDVVKGDQGLDTIHGGDGADDINGGRGRDIIYGGDGADVIAGAAQRDDLNGEAGDDIITGGLGNDAIDGGAGIDTCNGQGQEANGNGDVQTNCEVASGFPRLSLTLTEIQPPQPGSCLLYTSPSPRDQRGSRMPSSA